MAIQKTKNSTFFSTISQALEAQSKPLLLVFSFCIALGLCFFAHKLWVTHREKSVQYDFSALVQEYEIKVQEKDPEWMDLLQKFENFYKNHSNSSLLPYYLGYKVQILLHQKNESQALETLDSIIAQLQGSSLVTLYEMERALIHLDSTDESLQKRGLDALKKLAADHNNAHRDSAQFYLGRYYWSIDATHEAREVWQQLIDEQHDEKLAPSPWINYVQDKLNLINAE